MPLYTGELAPAQCSITSQATLEIYLCKVEDFEHPCQFSRFVAFALVFLVSPISFKMTFGVMVRVCIVQLGAVKGR